MVSVAKAKTAAPGTVWTAVWRVSTPGQPGMEETLRTCETAPDACRDVWNTQNIEICTTVVLDASVAYHTSLILYGRTRTTNCCWFRCCYYYGWLENLRSGSKVLVDHARTTSFTANTREHDQDHGRLFGFWVRCRLPKSRRLTSIRVFYVATHTLIGVTHDSSAGRVCFHDEPLLKLVLHCCWRRSHHRKTAWCMITIRE